MKKTQKKGFTLVELLVVISIIGMLMALLLPAVQMAREAGRRAVCLNNQKNVSLALLNYASGKGQLPGLLNKIETVPSGTYTGDYCGGWPVVLLPYLERADLWETASQNAGLFRNLGEMREVGIDVFVCPSNPDAGSVEGALCYRVNAGRSGIIQNPSGTILDSSYFGVFDFAKVPIEVSSSIVYATHTTGVDAIKDGSSLTLLLSEGVFDTTMESKWSDGYNYVASNFSTTFINGNTSDNKSDLERRLGFTVPYTMAEVQLNSDSKPETTNLPVGNPSSYHPGIMVVSFCDGHQATLAEDIDKLTYLQLVAPNDKKAKVYADANSLTPFTTSDNFNTKFLSEGDF